MFYGFASDNTAGAHPKILEAMVRANDGYVYPYAHDAYCAESDALFRTIFGDDIEICLALSGTGANIMALKTMLRPWQGVICSELAHVHTEESGALEQCTGSKLLTIPSTDGKIKPHDIDVFLPDFHSLHRVTPAVVSLSQSTEQGCMYTVQEIRDICQYAHAHGLYVHMDGARIANTVAAQNVDIKSMTTDAGVDILSFGGAKNGIAFGEAVVFLNRQFSNDYMTMRKQSLQLISKMRYLAAQFVAYLKDDLWLHNARHANDMAKYLAFELNGIKNIHVQAPECNAVFVRMNPVAMQTLMEEYYFYETDPKTHEARFMCSFSIQKEDIDRFVTRIKEIV